MSLDEVKDAQINLFSLFYFFLANASYFSIVDQVYNLKRRQAKASARPVVGGREIDSVVKMYYSKYFYYFKNIIDLIFDHDR